MRVYTRRGFLMRVGDAVKQAPAKSFVDVPDDQVEALVEDGSVVPATEDNKVVEQAQPKKESKADKPAKKKGGK